MDELVLLSPAKLNLFLHVTGRRPDGYHNLQTLFQLLDYGDKMSFESTTGGAITVTPALEGVAMKDNLIYRAARLLKSTSGSRLGASIEVEKKLPMGGGLGGGSSNAATTLLALNKLWQLEMSLAELSRLGRQLGADVPVFIGGRTAWAEGVGELLTPVDMPENWYLVLTPNCRISTAEIFQHPDLTRNTHPIKIRAFLEQGGRNDCQPVVEKRHPEVKQALQWLSQFSEARLTGTGASIFAQFNSRDQAETIFHKIPALWDGFIARGISASPVNQALKKWV